MLRRYAPTTVAICLLVAIAARRYAAMANADALLPALISTQRWTLFYWGQDRLANLVPLLAMPIRNPLWNFQFQTLIIAASFFGLAAMFVSFHCWSRGIRPRPLEHGAATMLAGLAVMAPMHVVAGYRFIVEQLYFVSVLLFLGAIYAWNRRRAYTLGAISLQIAFLVNPSLMLATPFAWLLDDEREGRLRRFAEFVAAALTAFAITTLAGRYLATGEHVDRPYDKFSLEHLRAGTSAVAGNIAGSMSDGLATTFVLLSVAVVAARARGIRPRSRSVYLALPVFATVWFVAFSTNGWVIQNAHEFRYFYPLYVTFMLYVAGASTECVLAVRPLLRRVAPLRPRLVTLLLTSSVLISMLVAVMVIRHVRVAAMVAAGESVEAAREFDVTLVVGNYWTTWPVIVAGRAEGLDLLGVTYRSDPILGDIQAALDLAEHQNRAVLVLCSGIDAPTCADELSRISTRDWMLSGTVSTQPLVISVQSMSD